MYRNGSWPAVAGEIYNAAKAAAKNKCEICRYVAISSPGMTLDVAFKRKSMKVAAQ